ncbi:hypothetical protein GCM10027167_06070 [Nocardia heshunensis]
MGSLAGGTSRLTARPCIGPVWVSKNKNEEQKQISAGQIQEARVGGVAAFAHRLAGSGGRRSRVSGSAHGARRVRERWVGGRGGRSARWSGRVLNLLAGGGF